MVCATDYIIFNKDMVIYAVKWLLVLCWNDDKIKSSDIFYSECNNVPNKFDFKWNDHC